MFNAEELMDVMKVDGIQRRLIPFHQRHVHMARLRKIDQELVDGYGRPHIIDYGVEGLSYTATYKSKVIVMFGLYPLWKGVAEAWMLPTEHLFDSKLIFHKATLRFFNYASEKLKLHRMQTYVCTTNYRAIKWMEMCYFNREGHLKEFGPDLKDYFVYGRLFNGVSK